MPRTHATRSAALHGVAIALAAVVFTPFVWLLWMSFRVESSAASLTLDNYRLILTDRPFARWLLNSLFLASTQTVLVVILSSMGGFALAKYRFRGRRMMMALLALTAILPAQVLLPSQYEMIRAIGWLDTYAAVILPAVLSIFGVFLFRQSMLGVPDELLQAARVDGCGELRLWWHVALPIVRPMTAAFTLLSFLGAWNSYLWPQIVLQSAAKYPMAIGLANVSQLPAYQLQPGVLMAGTVLSVLPVVLLYSLLQRDFVSGLTSGALKS